MPTGKVKFFDESKGFGFVAGDDGVEAYLPSSALPLGTKLRAGMRVEYGLAETRRGPQVLSLSVIQKVESLARKNRRSPEDLVPLIEDLIKILDNSSTQLRRGRYPEGGSRIAQALRTLADDFDA